MIDRLSGKNLSIIGGGRFCNEFLQAVLDWNFDKKPPRILGVADRNDQAPGLLYAKSMGIHTTGDVHAVLSFKDLDMILALTRDDRFEETIKRTRPAGVLFLDHFESRIILDYIKIEVEKRRVLQKAAAYRNDIEKIEELIEAFWGFIREIAAKRNNYAQKIRKDLLEREGAMAQILEGSPIPTFVIDQNHVVTHWNKACEKLTGFSSKEITGTNHQWKAFRAEKRPIMADLILDRVTEEEVWRYYGTKWRKSALIEDAFEAEEYFPHLGERGKWLFFTAAPLRSPDGTVFGAMETLQDMTEQKRAEEQLERHNKLLARTARDLAESERKTAQIIQGSTMPTFVIDKDHAITHWNRALENLTGYTAQEMVGTRKQSLPFWERERPTMADVILDRLGEEEIQKLYGNWRKSALIDGAYEAEEFFPGLGDSGKWCFFTAAPIQSPEGTITGAIETLLDITENKKAEEERERYYTEIAGLCSIYTALSSSLDLDLRLRASMEEIKNFLAADSICIFLRGEDGTFHLEYSLGAFQNACSTSSLSGQDSIIQRIAERGRLTVFEDLPEGDLAEIGLMEKEGIRSLAYIPISTKERGAIGVVRIGSKKRHHFSKEGQNILELIGNRIGVSVENSMLHKEYMNSEEKYRSLFNNDPNPIFIIDRQTLKILDINQRARDGYGYRRKELFGTSFLELGDESDEELSEGLRGLTRNRSVFFSKKKHFKKGLVPFYVNINASYATYRESDVIIAATTDVTETVEQETQLIQASKMTTLGQMAAGIAHEISQPLNVIQVCADFLRKTIGKGKSVSVEEVQALAEDITDNVQRAADIIKHMREFSRQSEVVRNRISINDPILDVFKVMGHQLENHNIDATLELAPDLPDIMAEHNRLEQVFINLVANAVDAMDEKGRLESHKNEKKELRIRSFTENNTVVVTVSDTGMGMSRAVIDKIFEPFFTTKKVGKGTGLGVSISYGIVRDYDGTIDVDSEEGTGSTFRLTFPALPPAGGPD